jgi:DNA-binding MarR family transcriptional regulator
MPPGKVLNYSKHCLLYAVLTMVFTMGNKQEPLGFLLADVTRLMRQSLQNKLSGNFSLTLSQARALIYLSRQQGIRQVELAGLLEVQPMTLARLIDQLVQNELVERRPDPLDRRAYCLYLSAQAKPHIDAFKRIAKEKYRIALKGIDSQQVDTLMSVLAKMRDNLSSSADL